MPPATAVMRVDTSDCLPVSDASPETPPPGIQPPAGPRAFFAAEMCNIHADSVQVTYSPAAASSSSSAERKAVAKLLEPETHRLSQRLRAELRRKQ